MKTVAVIFGGRSAEHDVSIVTALASIVRPLELTKKYLVQPVYIAKNGAWYWHERLKDIDLYTSGEIDNFLSRQKPARIELGEGLRLHVPSQVMGRSCTVDVVFPAMHGTYGEDGSLMGLLEMANVPYVGCGLSASVVAMDKGLAKQVARDSGIRVTPFEVVERGEVRENIEAIVARIEKSLDYPLFVKPAHLGSSIGISRVKNKKELINGLEVAVHYDMKCIVEEEVGNLIEVTLPIIGNEVPRPSLLERPLTKTTDFFDFETKYMQGGKKGGKSGGAKGVHGYSELPAKLPKKLYEAAQQTALEVYRAFDCSGIARVDLLIDSKTQMVYFNEMNPLPGDLYSHNWRASGVSSVDLVEKLVDLALERHQKRSAVHTVFETSYLKQF